jgi:uncharacterized protein YndB with AHSA1/START domain
VPDSDPIVNEIFIDAKPELVFRFLTEGDLMQRWIGVDVESDPRPGGIYRARWEPMLQSPTGCETVRGI